MLVTNSNFKIPLVPTRHICEPRRLLVFSVCSVWASHVLSLLKLSLWAGCFSSDFLGHKFHISALSESLSRLPLGAQLGAQGLLHTSMRDEQMKTGTTETGPGWDLYKRGLASFCPRAKQSKPPPSLRFELEMSPVQFLALNNYAETCACLWSRYPLSTDHNLDGLAFFPGRCHHCSWLMTTLEPHRLREDSMQTLDISRSLWRNVQIFP